MKATAKMIVAVAAGLLFTASAQAAQDIPFSGFLGNPAVYEQLQPGPKGGAKLRWVKQGVDAGKYKRFMVDSAVFFLAENADYKGIDPQEMKELCDLFNKEIAAAFQGKHEIVSQPGPDVARLCIAVTNIRPSRPGLSAVTTIVPVGLGVSLLKKGATGGWSGSGETCVEVMVLDSATNEILILAVDQRRAEFEDRFTRWGSAGDAFKFWSARMAEFIDNMKKKDK
ncbi:MAG TPA: DUF3313 domain-containing protein [Smithellaceae bacterium]|nr:DUF3313 domain-containing protein [Smithellaceae bacterium]